MNHAEHRARAFLAPDFEQLTQSGKRKIQQEETEITEKEKIGFEQEIAESAEGQSRNMISALSAASCSKYSAFQLSFSDISTVSFGHDPSC